MEIGNGERQHGGVLCAIFEMDCKRYKATLTSLSISWQKEKNPSYETCIPLTEVVSASAGTLDKTPANLQNLLSSNWSRRKETCPNGVPTTLTVYYIERAWKHRWKLRSLRFHNQDPNTIIQWVSHIRDTIESYQQRPKRLVVFINPFGGRRQANKIYEEKVRPLFELANIEANVIVTQRANHARDVLLQEMQLSKIDGVICVGGDGMFSELLIGLLLRTQTEHGIDVNNMKANLRRPQLRLGVIPGGSTDALAFSTTGTNDPVTSTLHIIIGDSVGVDVCGIYSDGKLVRYATTGVGYGYLGDTLIDSEKYRWMGPARYDYSGTKKFLQNRAYEGELLFRLAPESASTPRDRNMCTTGCKVCEKVCSTDQKDEDNFDVFAWRGVRGKFIGINLATVSCACSRTKRGLSPSAHLGDGYADIIVINQCSRISFFRYLFATAFQKNPFRFPFVNVYRVREVQFRPLGAEDTSSWPANASSMQHFPSASRNAANNSVWNVDGEICENAALHVKVHCQLIRMFARGVEDFSPDVTCIPCSSESDPNCS